MRPLRLLALLVLVAGLSAAPVQAEQQDSPDPSVSQYEVCSAILESCNAACTLYPLEPNVVLSAREGCNMQCGSAYRQCMKGLLRTTEAVRQSVRNPLQNFIGDGTPNNPPPPTDVTDQPAEPKGGKPTDGGFTFNPGAVAGAQAAMVIQ